MKQTSLGNPQLGKADPKNPNPMVYDNNGKPLYKLSICNACGGYYAIVCPCKFRKNGKL